MLTHIFSYTQFIPFCFYAHKKYYHLVRTKINVKYTLYTQCLVNVKIFLIFVHNIDLF